MARGDMMFFDALMDELEHMTIRSNRWALVRDPRRQAEQQMAEGSFESAQAKHIKQGDLTWAQQKNR